MTQGNLPPSQPNVDQPRSCRQRTAAIVIYATFALLAVTIPQSLVNWLGDMRGNAVQERLLRGAEFLQSFSNGTGIATPYRRSRDLFNALTGHSEN